MQHHTFRGVEGKCEIKNKPTEVKAAFLFFLRNKNLARHDMEARDVIARTQFVKVEMKVHIFGRTIISSAGVVLADVTFQQ